MLHALLTGYDFLVGCQVVIKKTFLSWLMSSCHNKDILNNVNFASKVSEFTE